MFFYDTRIVLLASLAEFQLLIALHVKMAANYDTSNTYKLCETNFAFSHQNHKPAIIVYTAVLAATFYLFYGFLWNKIYKNSSCFA